MARRAGQTRETRELPKAGHVSKLSGEWRRFAVFNQAQSETGIEVAAGMSAATGQAREAMANPADTREVARALGATVEEAALRVNRCEWETMATFLIADAKIVARLPPFPTMRRNPAAASSELGKQMRELVSQGAINLSRMMHELRIQRDQFRAIIGAPGACFQSRIPVYPKFASNSRGAIGAQKLARLRS